MHMLACDCAFGLTRCGSSVRPSRVRALWSAPVPSGPTRGQQRLCFGCTRLLWSAASVPSHSRAVVSSVSAFGCLRAVVAASVPSVTRLLLSAASVPSRICVLWSTTSVPSGTRRGQQRLAFGCIRALWSAGQCLRVPTLWSAASVPGARVCQVSSVCAFVLTRAVVSSVCAFRARVCCGAASVRVYSRAWSAASVSPLGTSNFDDG